MGPPPPLRYRTLQAFAGNAAAGQLSFAGYGEILLVKDAATANMDNGWGYGMKVATQQSGWFPSTFVELIVENENENGDDHPLVNKNGIIDAVPFGVATASATTTPTTISNHQQQQQTATDAGGGSSSASSLPSFQNLSSTAQEQQQQGQPSWLQPDNGSSSSSSSSLRSTFRKAGKTVSSATLKAGATVGSGLTHATKQTSSFFSNGLQNSSLFPNKDKNNNCTTTTTTIPATTTETTQTTTNRGWFGSGGRTTTTTTTTTRTAPTPCNQEAHKKQSSSMSVGEKVAGVVGTTAALTAATQFMKGNIKGGLRSSAVSATAFATQGHVAAANSKNQQPTPTTNTMSTSHTTSTTQTNRSWW